MSAGRQPRRAVVIGGGTGAPTSIKALLGMGLEVSAVVAMADDGGSTGILRERAGAIPPGDIRKCLVAMAADEQEPVVRAFKYRFDYASNHALGNLVLTALADTAGSFPEAIRICERLLNTRGHVYPSTLEQVRLFGRTRDGRKLQGQANVSKSDCALARVSLAPSDAGVYEPAAEAIRQADLIVLGPGSLFTSIIPNLLVPGIIDAIKHSPGITVFVCSLADMQGETWGLDCAEHVEALLDHGMRDMLDFALIHADKSESDPAGAVTRAFAPVTGFDPDYSLVRDMEHAAINRVEVTPGLVKRIEGQDCQVILGDYVDVYRPTWHDVDKLAAAFGEVLSRCPSQPM